MSQTDHHKTWVIFNPSAGGGQPEGLTDTLQQAAQSHFGGDVTVQKTDSPDAVLPVLKQAYNNRAQRVLSVGGDGTNHSVVNALMQLCEQDPSRPALPFGSVPVGTGQDWARSLGTPLGEFDAAMQWLAARDPQPTDAVRVTLDDTHTEYMLNVASTGLGGEVDRRVNTQSGRGPFTFTRATVGAILQYQPQPVQVTVDGALWYEDSAYTVVVANGPMFGQGMKIAPGASVDDGLLDVLVVKGVSRWSLLMALWRVYNGSHLSHPAVMHTQAARVEITSDSVLPLDMDGEYSQARRLVFAVQPGCLSVLR